MYESVSLTPEFIACLQCDDDCLIDQRHDHGCIRCDTDGTILAVDNLGYCAQCHWGVRPEIMQAIYELDDYLGAWAKFSAWLEKHQKSSS